MPSNASNLRPCVAGRRTLVVLTRRQAKGAPHSEWSLQIALCRFGGFRCPSEHLALRWDGIDWQRDRMHVQSPKTERHEGHESRDVPLFPELRANLEGAFELARPGVRGRD